MLGIFEPKYDGYRIRAQELGGLSSVRHSERH